MPTQEMNGRSPKVESVHKLKDRFREETSVAIMAAAEEVFAAEGLHAAHMGNIAARAGVAVGTLYNHFADRESLLSGLLDARSAELIKRLDESIAGAQKLPFEEQLRILLGACFEHFEAHWPFFKILMQSEQGNYRATFPSATPKSAATVAEILGRFETLVRQGVRKKVLRAEGAEFFPAMLLGTMRGLMMREFRAGNSAPKFGAHIERVAQFFLRGAGR